MMKDSSLASMTSPSAGKGQAGLEDIPLETAIRAVEWHLQIQSETGDNQTLQAQLHHWLAQHPDHTRAWRRIKEVNARFEHLVAGGSSQAIQTALNQPHSPARRQALKYLALVLGLSGGTWTLHRTVPWRAMAADYRTGIGEQLHVTLGDGTLVVLNTDSALTVRFTENERRLSLIQGELSVTTGKDISPDMPARGSVRPLVVTTRQGLLRPLGTRFVVRQYPDRVRLDVFEGAVQILPDDSVTTASVIAAGQRAFFDSSGMDIPEPINQNDTAWLDKLLVASGTRLADFVAELKRYRTGYLSCDPAIADLKVSGTYPLRDTDHILQTLPRILPIEVHYLSRYWVRILPKST